MANYWERPTAEQFNFTPYRPPVEETLGAIAAKTQYYTDTLNRIKTEYDAVAGKEVSRDDSKAKLAAFRESVEPKLKELAKKDLSIGSYRNEALSLYEPVLRDKGLLVDEATTEQYGKILKQAKEDASKNGGKYYNQYSVEYASQMMERYKRETNAENSDYHSILTSVGYIPYNQEAESEIRKSVEKLSKETITEDEVDPKTGYKIRRTRPAYSTSDIAAMMRESLSPAARQQYDLQARVEFNRFQLNSRTPEQLQAIGQTIKNQFNTYYNEQIGILNGQLAKVDETIKLLSENDPEYNNKKAILDQNRAYFETQKKQAEGERDKIDVEYFTNPSNWKLGESYYSDLYINNKIRNASVALGNRRGDSLISMDVFNAQTARMKALKDKEGKTEEARTMAETVQSTTTVGTYEQDGEKTFQKLKDFRIANDDALSVEVQKAMNVTVRDPQKGNVAITEAFSGMQGDTPMSKVIENMNPQGIQSLDAIISIVPKETILKENPKAFDKDGNIQWDKITTSQVRKFMNLAMVDKSKLPTLFEKAGYDGNKVDIITNLYLENSKKNHKNKATINKFSPIYEQALKAAGFNTEAIKDNLFNFDTADNLLKAIDFDKIESELNAVSESLYGTGFNIKLNTQTRKAIVDYIRTGNSDALPPQLKMVGATKTITADSYKYGAPIDSPSSPLTAIGPLNNFRNNYLNAISKIKEDISKDPSLTFNTVEANYTYNAKPTPTDDKSSQPYVNYTEFQNLLANSTATPDGSSPDGNVSKYETMINGLRNLGMTDVISGIRFVAGADGEIAPHMVINVDPDKFKKMKDNLPESDDGTMWWKDGDIENQLTGKGVKIYLTNPDMYKKFIKIPDRSVALLQGNNTFNANLYSSDFNPNGGTYLKVKNIGYGNDIVPALDGKTRMITNWDGNNIVFENVSFNEKNMDDIIKYQNISLETINPKNKEQFKGLEAAVGYIMGEDAKLVALEKLAKSWNILEQKDGKYYINLQGLDSAKIETIKKLIRDGKIGNQ